jgi:hypothetical protein
MAPPDKLYATPAIRAAASARGVFSAVLVVGALTSVFWRPGVVLLLTGLAGVLAAQLVVGITAYRRAMRRPWPAVRPLESDEDDW